MPVTPRFFEEAAESGFVPMTMRPQAHDIIRTWAFDTIVKSWFHNSSIPWETIVISGHVLSTQKEKISKSQGNTPLTPENLLQQYPADAVRYWTASGNLGYDISFSENQIKIGSKLLVKLWNAFRFLAPHIQGMSSKDAQPQKLGAANEWILTSISRCLQNYEGYFKEYEFSLALSTIEQFFWSDFCDNYLEIIKDQMLNPQNYSAHEVQATQWTLYQLGIRILQLYAPFVPHVTETIYREMYHRTIESPSLHMTKFATYHHPYEFPASVTLMTSVMQIIALVRKLKTEKQLSLKTDLELLTIGCPDTSLRSSLAAHLSLIKGVTRALEVAVVAEHRDTDLSEEQGIFKASVNL
jgi:valyl-tRNA synthetase